MKTLILIGLLSLLAWQTEPLSQKFQAGQDVNLSTPTNHDVYVAGETVTLHAPVQGDVMAAGGTVVIRDHIAEDLVLAGGDLVVDGSIGEDLMVMGGSVRIHQPVKNDLIVMGGEVIIDPYVTIGNELLVMAGKVIIDGKVEGNIKARGGELILGGICQGQLDMQGEAVTINGLVRGKAILAAESIRLGKDAQLYGPVAFWTEDPETVDFTPALFQDAKAQFNESLRLEDNWSVQPWSGFLFVLAYLLSVLILIVLVHGLIAKVMAKSAQTLQQETVRSLGYGVLYFLGVPLGISLLMITVIGIPLGLFALFLYLFSVLFALTLSAVMLTYQIRDKYQYDWSKGKLILVSLGLFVVLRLLSFVPLLGIILVSVVVGACYGAMILFFLHKEKVVIA